MYKSTYVFCSFGSTRVIFKAKENKFKKLNSILKFCGIGTICEFKCYVPTEDILNFLDFTYRVHDFLNNLEDTLNK